MNFSRPGAIDLSALAQPQSQSAPAPAGSTWVVDVTEQTFESLVLEASMRHVVVLSLWSARAPQSADFNALLARVTDSYGGQILLAQVDIDAHPQIAQALQAQGVPYVVGLVKGQPIPLFQGTADEADIRQYFDQLIAVAAQNGVTARAEPTGVAAEQHVDEALDDPRFAAADEAFANNDFDTVIAEYQKLAEQTPADPEVAERLAGAKLMSRTFGQDLDAARAAAAAGPDDLEAQLLVADFDVSGGHIDDAFDRLLDLIAKTSGDQRDQVRGRLLELFTVVGSSDPRVAKARRALGSALF